MLHYRIALLASVVALASACGGGSNTHEGTCSATCADLGLVCGTAPNGCGGTIDCGQCRWQREDLSGQQADIAVAPDGTVYAATLYFNDLHFQVVGDGSDAFENYSDPDGRVGDGPDLEIGADGSIHMVYSTDPSGGDNKKIRYGTHTSSGWDIVTISPPAKDAVAPVLALDGASTPHVVYFVENSISDIDLFYATIVGGTWTTTQVAYSGGTTFGAALALDAAGVPRMFVTSGGHGLVMVTPSGDGFTEETVSTYNSFGVVRAAFAPDGEPRVVALPLSGSGSAVEFTRSGGTWNNRGLTTAWDADGLGFAIDAEGGSHIVFYEQGEGAHYFGPHASQLFGDACGEFNAVALGADNAPHLLLGCVGYTRIAGAFPASYKADCDGFAAELCANACPCGSGNSCCYQSSSASTCWSPESACPDTVRQHFCEDPFADPTLITQCRADYAAQGPLCVGGYEQVPAGACTTVY